MSDVQDGLQTLERFRNGINNLKTSKAAAGGKPVDISAGIQECLGLLANYNSLRGAENVDVVLAALRALEEAVLVVSQAATILRLEGGLKILLKVFKAYLADGAVLTVASRVLCRYVSGSPVNQQAIAKEKGLSSALLPALSAHYRDATAVPPLLELVVALSRTGRGAQCLAGEAMVTATREILVNFMGNWPVVGLAVKALKLQSKFEVSAAALMRVGNGEVSRTLLALARLLARTPGQRKLLKRTSRALWLLHRSLLPALPELEPLVPLPPRDTPHLSLAAAPDTSDTWRLMELLPEEFPSELQPATGTGTGTGTGSQPTTLQAPAATPGPAADASPGQPAAYGSQAPVAGRVAHMVRPPRFPTVRPPSAGELTSAVRGAGVAGSRPSEPFHTCDSGLEIDMMMHDLRRIVHPESVQGRLVYDSMAPETASCPAIRSGLAGLSLSPSSSLKAAPLTPSVRSSPSARPQPTPMADRGGTPGSYEALLHEAAGRDTAPRPTTGPTLLQSMAAARRGVNPQASLPSLQFESNFEGGNLRAAVQVYDNEYDLFLASDLNDRSEGGNLCQWFYFSVSGVQPGVPYKFNLVNFRKKQSLFASGKQPLVCRATRQCGTSSRPPSGSVVPPVAATTPPQQPPACDAAAQQAGDVGSAGVGEGATDSWVRAGACVSYYPSPYRGRRSAQVQADTAASKRPLSKGTAKQSSTRRAGNRSTGSPAPGQLQPPLPPTTATTPSGGNSASSCTATASSAGQGRDSARDTGASSDGPTPGSGPGLWCATFTLVFPQPGVYFVASCYPYTYTDLQEHLDKLTGQLRPSAPDNGQPDPTSASSHSSVLGEDSTTSTTSLSPGQALLTPSPVTLLSGILVRSPLCFSLSGHLVDVLTITDFAAPPEAVTAREVVFITARVHPGETCASWICQGVLDFLVSQDPVAQMLRASFVFKVVPMLNPDGVINGSYRCSLAGMDLNRTWERPNKAVQPTVYHTKRLMQAVAAGGVGRLALYIDIHGHSNKEDVFFYGCEPNLNGYPPSSSSPAPTTTAQPTGTARQASLPRNSSGSNNSAPADTEPCGGMIITGLTPQPAVGAPGAAGVPGAAVNPRAAARLRVRMLPYLLSKMSDKWSMSKCSFRIRKAKLGAGRVVVHRELGCAGAYTLEASLGGRSSDRTHFSAADYLAMGKELCRGIGELAEVDDGSLLDEMSSGVTLQPYVGAYTV